MTEVSIDPEAIERSVSSLLRLVEQFDGREFAFRDPRVVGSPVTDGFDRAYHTFSWTLAQCLSGENRALLDDADSVVAVVGDLSLFEGSVATRLSEARQSLEYGGL